VKAGYPAISGVPLLHFVAADSVGDLPVTCRKALEKAGTPA
jgi:hypothetical protein